MLKSRAQLKAEAKALLSQHFGKLFVVTFLPALLAVGVFYLVLLFLILFDAGLANVVASSDALSMVVIILEIILYPLTIFALSLVTLYINVGISYTLLDFIRTKNPEVLSFGNAFRCFKKDLLFPIFKLGFFRNLFLYLWAFIPLAGSFLVIVKTYAYEQTFFMYKDNANKNLPATNYITHSRQLMDGHKGDRFVMDLSFIGWALLGSISFGLAYIWIAPYYLLTTIGYYNNLLEHVVAQQAGQAGPQTAGHPQAVQPQQF